MVYYVNFEKFLKGKTEENVFKRKIQSFFTFQSN